MKNLKAIRNSNEIDDFKFHDFIKNNKLTGYYFDCDGNLWFFRNGIIHRSDGPAITYNTNNYLDKYRWIYNGKYFDVSSTEEFMRRIKLQIFE